MLTNAYEAGMGLLRFSVISPHSHNVNTSLAGLAGVSVSVSPHATLSSYTPVESL